jgi:colanic acid/amylovoran biosynthesis glycosyltransferase
MRVVHYVSAFSTLSQTFIYDYITESYRQGVDTVVLTLHRENESDRPFDQVSVLRIPPRWHPRRLREKIATIGDRSPDRVLQYTWAVRRISIEAELRRLAPDVVHVHFGPFGVHLAPVTRLLGIPLVVTFYGFDASRLPSDSRWVDRYMHLWADASAVTVLSEAMRSTIIGLGCPPDKVTIVHLGKNLAEYPFSPPSPPLRRFLSVGRLVEKKGHMDVIEAMHELKTSGTDVELTIVGDGPMRGALDTAVSTWGLEDRVRLVGPENHVSVIRRMRQASAFVLGSKTAPDGDQEGTPTVLLEAQAIGLPCVTTRHGGIPEQIPTESHWLLAEEGDSAGIAERMKALSSCSATQLTSIARAGRSKIEREFDLSKEVSKLVSLYGNL